MPDDKTKLEIQQNPVGVPGSPMRFPRAQSSRKPPPERYVNHSCGHPMVAVRFLRDGAALGTEERGWRCGYCNFQRPAEDSETEQWESARGFSGGRGVDVKIPSPAPDPAPTEAQPPKPEIPAPAKDTIPIPENEDELRKLIDDHPHLKASAGRLISTLQQVTPGAEAVAGSWLCPTCEESNPLTEPVSGEISVRCTCGKSAEIAVYAVGDPMQLNCPACGGTAFDVERERLPAEEGDIVELRCPECEAIHELRREDGQIRWVPPAISAE